MIRLPAALSLLLAFLITSPAFAAKQPNVIILLPDQWRAFATGYAGDPNVKTPHLDRLAASSINFVNAVSTVPVCSPMRASLITGQFATTHGVFINDVHLADHPASMARLFNAAGYDTAFIGKWHINGDGRSAYIPPEQRQGFKYWRALECTHNYNKSPYYADGVERLMWPGYDGFAQTKDAIKYVKDRAADAKPFCMVLAWGPPHNPYQTAPEEYAKLYEAEKIQLRPNVPPEAQAQTRKDLAGYYAHCSALDKCVGDVMTTLKETGIADDTIVVFTSDHGDMLGSRNLERKQKPWDESARVPMLWHCPSLLGADAKKIDTPMNTEDILPTLLGLCGIEVPKSIEGLDYSGFLRGSAPNPNPDNAALIACPSPFGEWTRAKGGKEYRGVRTPRYTYVRDLTGPWLLYDDQTDPYQQDNLINQPQAAQIQKQLDEVLTRKLKAAHDEFLPGEQLIAKWGWKVDKNGTAPYTN